MDLDDIVVNEVGPPIESPAVINRQIRTSRKKLIPYGRRHRAEPLLGLWLQRRRNPRRSSWSAEPDAGRRGHGDFERERAVANSLPLRRFGRSVVFGTDGSRKKGMAGGYTGHKRRSGAPHKIEIQVRRTSGDGGNDIYCIHILT